MVEDIREECPACGHPLGFVCKECGSDLELDYPWCDICGGEVELVAFMTDKETGAMNEDVKSLIGRTLVSFKWLKEPTRLVLIFEGGIILRVSPAKELPNGQFKEEGLLLVGIHTEGTGVLHAEEKTT
ncbi:unnamed protein product [marine sediment metagenome]|uniref:Uncharacterized protein n=1 Tax=marine sediment metagenome TaxID=412755 RepID=X1H7C2_9ZZZZ